MSALDPLEIPLDRRCLVEASAGTGKTFTIALLYVRLVMERGLGADEILVVTYTRAAAAELRERIRARLQETARALEARLQSDVSIERGPHSKVLSMVEACLGRGRPDEELQCLKQALRGFDEAMISTIHGFCQRMLDENAFESGAAFGAELVTQQGALVDQVVADFWTRSLYSESPDFIHWLRATSKGGEKIRPRLLAQLVDAMTSSPRIVLHPNEVPSTGFDLKDRAQALADVKRLWEETGAEALVQLAEAAERKVLNGSIFKKDRIVDLWRREIEAALANPRVGFTQSKGSPQGVARMGQRRIVEKTNKGKTAPHHPLFEAIDTLLDLDAAADEAFSERWLAMEMDLAEYTGRELSRRRRSARSRSYDDLLTMLADALEGPAGENLASTLRTRFPVALIDEFQDTDPIQYAIFRGIWGSGPGGFFLIGDPKQAIYGFRGADVFAYMQARRDSEGHRVSLDRNWRSDPSVITGINTLFARVDRPFLFDDIPFHPALPAPDALDRLDAPGRTAGLRLLLTPPTPDEKLLNKGQALHEAAAGVARDIADLLDSPARVEDRRVRASDVAVLCRTNRQVEKMQSELRRLGIPSVMQSQTSVFETEEADALERILEALSDPTDVRAVRAAISTIWVGAEAAELEAIQQDPDRLDPWLDRLEGWGDRLRNQGVLAFTESLIQTPGTRNRILAQIDGERRLTNWMHLAELMQAQSGAGGASPRVQWRWVVRMRRDAAARSEQAGDDAVMRLESDARAVQLVTIHNSKGLQYGIVYCPFLWDGRLLGPKDRAWPRFHDPDADDLLTIDLGSEELAKNIDLSEYEVMAENIRLVYVALTRARYQVAVVWGAIRDSHQSPMAHLLHPLPRGEEQSRHGPAWLLASQQHVKALKDEDRREDLAELAAASDHTISVETLVLDSRATRPLIREEFSVLGAARRLERPVRQTHFVSSFSKLVAGAAGLALGQRGVSMPVWSNEHPLATGRDYDRAGEGTLLDGPSVLGQPVLDQSSPVVLHEFPAGSGPGTLIHGILEHLDFQGFDRASLERICEEALARAGMSRGLAISLAVGLEQALSTPLGGGLKTVALRDVPRDSRIDEMEFTMPVAPDAFPALTPQRLADVFARHAESQAVREYAPRIAGLGFDSLTGYLRGFVDLIFRHEGRYYVVDYKSNRLGEYAEDYKADALVNEMQRHDYILQYHIYCVALHRLLSTRLSGYDPREHLGGAYYLFLRGMSPHTGSEVGIYYDRPSEALLAALSEVLGPMGEMDRGEVER